VLDDEILDHLRRQGEQKRKHAAFFAWYDRSPEGKGVAEAGVVGTLLESMNAAGHSDYTRARASADPWPDCWAQAEDGTLAPFEVTELVNQSALPAGEAQPWSDTQICTQLQTILSKKDARTHSGRGSRQVVLVIHTDELYLDPANVWRALGDDPLVLPLGNLARAFLLFSYDPKRGGYPFIELRLAA
jgi:hypothetical protein